jgi:hypothetical protein
MPRLIHHNRFVSAAVQRPSGLSSPSAMASYPINDSMASIRGPRIRKKGLWSRAGRATVGRSNVGSAALIRFSPTRRHKIGAPALVCSVLSPPTEFEDISFRSREDEILLFYGLVGPGSLTGVTRPSRGAITLAAKTVAPKSSVDPTKVGYRLCARPVDAVIALAIGISLGIGALHGNRVLNDGEHRPMLGGAGQR